MASTEQGAGGSIVRWRMLLIGFLAQNMTFGLTYAAFGTLVPAIQAELHIGRTYAVTGLSLMSLTLGVLAPFAGRFMKRFGIRRIMLLGGTLCASGYLILAHSATGPSLLIVYGSLIGPGLCMVGIIPSSALAAGWFPDHRGRVLGVVNMPAMTVLAPPVVAWFVQQHDLQTTFLALGFVQLLLLPILVTIAEPPETAGTEAGQVSAPDMSTVAILRDRGFIVLAIAIGLLTMAGVGAVTHLVPLAADRGVVLQKGALLLSSFGIASVFGAMAFGWAADRFGGRGGLAILAIGWIAPWVMLLMAGTNFTTLLLAAAAIGFFSGGINPLLTATMGSWLGQNNFGPAMGLCYFIKIPFLFLAAPLDGAVREATGTYDHALWAHIGSFLFVAILVLLFGRRADSRGHR